jgi:hypothetical protein
MLQRAVAKQREGRSLWNTLFRNNDLGSHLCKFLRKTAGYTKLDKKRNTEILRELKINSALEHIDQYRNNWKQHEQRMDWSHIPRQMMTYRPKGKRSLGRPLERWTQTVTVH